MSLTAGSRVGQYEVAEAIGAGGMGVVFRARDHALGRDVAIKILPQAVSDDPERRQRFAREARLLAAVNHAHIAQVYGIEDSVAGSAIVMELVPGSTLRDLLRFGPIGARDAVAYARQIALALDAAHEKGIIHRDLKPDNVKVTPEGVVKVLDFGLAKVWAGEEGTTDDQTMTAAPETRSGRVMGTVEYMSPEQARGQAVDRRTDIWAFGCVLFELFSGRSPFGAPTASDTIAAVLEKDPGWEALPRSTPLQVRHLIARCLEKDRRLRLRDIGDALPELADDSASTVASAARGTTQGSSRLSRAWRPLGIGFAAAAVLFAATTFWLWSRDRGASSSLNAPRPVRFALPPPPGSRFGSNISNIETTTIAFSPDGTRLAFIATPTAGPPVVFVRALDDENARAVPGTEGAVSVFWSPDSLSLGFFVGDKLKRIAHTGGAAVPICDVPVGIGMYGTWGPSGDILFASVQGDAILRVPARGGTASPVIRTNEVRKRVLWPRYLPDGERFLYMWMDDRLNGEVVLVDRDGTEHSIMTALSQPHFVEPDIVLVVRESTLIAQRIDLSTGRPIGEPVSIIGQVAYSAATGWAEVTVSPNGMLAVQTHRDVSHMTLVKRSGITEGTVSTPGSYLSVRAALDGSALLFSRLRPELGTYDIWMMSFARGGETPLTDGPGMETGEVWLPGMQSIVIAAARGGPPNLFLRDLATGTERRLLQSPRFHFATDVSPDGKIVAYQQRSERGNWDLMQVRLDDTSKVQPVSATSASEMDLRFAPAGGRMAFVSDESGRPEVYVAPFPSTTPKTMVSSGGGFWPRWRRDGRELFFVSPSRTLMVATMTDDGRPGHPQPLLSAAGWANYDVMDNGARFVAIVRESVGYEQPLTILLNWQRALGIQ